MSASTDFTEQLQELQSDFKWGIVIPTIGTPEILVPSLQRLIHYLPDAKTEGRVVISICINPVEANLARMEDLQTEIDRLQELIWNLGHELIWENVGKPIGFGNANNRGIALMVENHGLPGLTILFNDDLRVSPGWLQGLSEAQDADYVRLISEPPRPGGDGKQMRRIGPDKLVPAGVRPNRSRADYGRIGIIGPCSNAVAGMQKIELGDANHQVTEANSASFAKMFRKDNVGEFITTNFLSGFCMAVVAGCMLDLTGDDDWELFKGDTYPIAGYEDNDLCVQAERAGWRLLIDGQTFIYHLGHASFDAHFPGMDRGMRNRLAYYIEHREETQNAGQKVIGCIRLKLETGNDLGLLRSLLVGWSKLLDGIAILLTDSPLEMGHSEDWKETLQTLSPWDREWLQECMTKDGEGQPLPIVAAATAKWCKRVLRKIGKKYGGREIPVVVKCWDAPDGLMNERDERNESIRMAEEMGADWIWSIDGDELPDDRFRRWHVERLMSHPDPMVHSWDFGWMNHWDNPRVCRADMPWGDAVPGKGMTYKGGMHGFRLWRVCKEAPRRIQAGTANGLHCGNSPDASMESKRVAGFRFRHYGYLRSFDRQRKLIRYRIQDPNPDPLLVGGSNYSHLVSEEGMTTFPYVEVNGIGLSMLVYENEDPDDVARILDWMYGLSDAVVLTWTGDWEEADRAWVDDPSLIWDDSKPWPSTGPSIELAKYADLFGVRWIYQPLNDNIAAARNAGLEMLSKLQGAGLGWAFFMDPDEHFQQPYQDMVCLRRMAEVSNGWGWLFQFYNLLPDGQAPSLSESVRMTRLDPEGVMRMNGRVHEGFDDAVGKIRAAGDHPHFRYAPFKVLNMGQRLSNEEMTTKLQRYTDLLYLELKDNPLSAKSWTSLGMQAENEGDIEAAVQCYQYGMLCPGNSYLPFKELAGYHLRMAKALMGEVLERTSGAHAYYKYAAQITQSLREFAPERPLVGMAREGIEHRKGLGRELPAFPMASDAVVIHFDAGDEKAECDPGGTGMVALSVDLDKVTCPDCILKQI